MSNTSYYLYQKYEQRGEQAPIPVYPNVYSIDGEGTMPLVKKMDNDPSCGYVPPVEPIYRWVNIDITKDYVCNECPKKFRAAYTGDIGYILYCDDSTRLTRDETKPSGYNYSAMTSAVIGDCVTSLDGWTFSECGNLSSVTISNSVSLIYMAAFYYCSGLTSIDLPVHLTLLEEMAFEGCSSLTSIVVPNSVTHIKSRILRDCTSLTSATISNRATDIDVSAFEGCSGLTRLNSDENGDANIPSGVTYIGWSAFEGCSGLTSINIPSGVTIIDGYAFSKTPWYNSYKTDASHHSGNIIYINNVAYEAVNRNITSCSFRNATTCIAGDCFSYCSGLTSVSIPDSVTYIGDYAFNKCIRMTSVTIGNGVTRIGLGAFDSCTALTSVTVNATTPPRLTGNNVFYGSSCPIYVPAASVDTYKSASGWSTYASRIQAIN